MVHPVTVPIGSVYVIYANKAHTDHTMITRYRLLSTDNTTVNRYSYLLQVGRHLLQVRRLQTKFFSLKSTEIMQNFL